MQIKKLLYLSITVVATSITLAASFPTLSSLNNNDNLNDQIFNTSQQNTNTDYSDQLEYIRNDVQKQSGITNSIASIKYADESSADSHSAALVTKTDGSTLLYMWGLNNYGQLGFSASGSTAIPTLVSPTYFTSKITQIALGYRHSAALLEDGTVYMWGWNKYGQLGRNPSVSETSLPTRFGLFNIAQISLGENHSAALLKDGNLCMWGSNYFGQLGDTKNNMTDSINYIPFLVSSNFFSSTITKITLFGNQSAALLADGTMYTWGQNLYGQLGYTSDTIANPNPTKVTELVFGEGSGVKISQISLGRNHSAALLTNGAVYTWGNNHYGQLGNTRNITTDNANATPTMVNISNFSSRVVQIELGSYFSAALLADGSLYMWGSNYTGEIGTSTNKGTRNPNPTPAKVTISSTSIITQIVLSSSYSAAILKDSSLYMWGSNGERQLGNSQRPLNNNHIPILSYLGKDSHIKASSKIAAKTAFDNIWVDNKFNLDGFMESFELINIPQSADQEITMDNRPTFNNNTGTVTMNVKIKYFYGENGLIVTDTAANPMLISGFKIVTTKTNITAKTTLMNSVVIDKWLTYVNVDGKINRGKLGEFLTLSDVPTDAEFTITNHNPNNKTGVLTFNISTSKIIDINGGVWDYPSDSFSITLNLTPRITKMTTRAGYPSNLTPTALKYELVDNMGLVKNVGELNKYMTVIAPVDGAQYYLVDNKWDKNGGDGTVKFSIYVSKYYDNEGNEKTGSSTVAASKVDFDLQLKRETSNIGIKSKKPDIRVDNFETYINSAGTVVATSKLGEFFDLTNIPSDATFSITDVMIDKYSADFTRNHLTFNLTITKFNQGVPLSPQVYTNNYDLTLGTQHQQTVIKAKSTYDQSIRVDKVANELSTLSGSALVGYLNNYIDMQSIPDGATITVGSITPVDATGELIFNVIPSQIYNANSELAAPTTDQFIVTLQFGIKHAPTNITINLDYTKSRVDQFANNVNALKGQDLYAYLVPDYVSAVSVNEEKLTAKVISQDNSNGKITIGLSVSQYYDADSRLVHGVLEVILDYELTPIYKPTSIRTLPASVYPQDLTPAQFKQRLETDGAVVVGEQYTLSQVNVAFIKKFLVIESVPADTKYIMTFVEQTYAAAAQINFSLMLDKYYNADGNLTFIPKTYDSLGLSLIATDLPVKPKTEITAKSDVEVVNAPDDFLNSIENNDGSYNLEVLGKYIDGLNTLPLEGNVLEIISNGINPDGTANFILKVSSFYNGTDSNPQVNGEFQFTVKTKQVHSAVTEEQFPWWWILVGVGGAATVGLGVWFFLKKQNGGYGRGHTMKRSSKTRRFR